MSGEELEHEDFDTMIETYMDMASHFRLPQYLPVDSDVKSRLDKFKVQSETSIIAETRKSLMKSIDALLLQRDSGALSDTLQSALDALHSLETVQRDNKVLRDSLEYTKSEINKRYNSEEPLSHRNLEFYEAKGAGGNGSIHALFSEIHGARKDAAVAGNSRAVNKDILKVKQHIFVVEHPEEPLPSELTLESTDEDDVQVDGGKIDLHCPISMQLYENPLMSRKCGHTFSQNSLKEYLKTKNDCPISGCSGTLHMRDFEEDVLMKLRVQSYLRSKDKERERNREGLDLVV